jgi:protein-L-isoaspartate O-methyltransferase
VKKFWQTEWQGIQFSAFVNLSSKTLPDANFYNTFYRELFLRYSGYSELDKKWRESKDVVADWIAEQLPSGARVLSVGCGLGYVEQKLWKEHGDRIESIELHVTDYAGDALRWLREVIPDERIHDAAERGQLDELEFDIIYLSAVDYALSDKELIHLLTQLKERLKDTGRLIMVSASYLAQFSSLSRVIKDVIKDILDVSGVRSRGQFWGWMRSRKEYQNLMNLSGFSAVDDGFIDLRSQTYWVSGEGSVVDV